MRLTNREIDICKQIITGKSNVEIGQTLYLSTHTIKAYIAIILKKTDTKNRTQLAYLLGKANIIEP